MIDPLLIGTPDSILPVIAGWIPCPVAALLNRPSMTLIFVLSGSNGARDSLSSIPAPDPFAHHRPGLMPVPMNSTAKRWGGGALVAAEADELRPKPDSDSSHGRPIVTPAPRSMVLRDNARSPCRCASFCVLIIDHLVLAVSSSRPRLLRNWR